jgi:hypothetical protein
MAQKQDTAPKYINAFFPGQKGLLAQQLNAGFGGGLKNWSNQLDKTYSAMPQFQPYPYPAPENGGKDNPGGGKKDPSPGDPGTPPTDPNTDPGGYHWNSHSALPMGGLAALAGNGAQQTAPYAPQMAAAPQYAALTQQMMTRQPNGLMALNPQAMAFYRQIYGSR